MIESGFVYFPLYSKLFKITLKFPVSGISSYEIMIPSSRFNILQEGYHETQKFSSFVAAVLIFALIFSLFLREPKRRWPVRSIRRRLWKTAKNRQAP